MSVGAPNPQAAQGSPPANFASAVTASTPANRIPGPGNSIPQGIAPAPTGSITAGGTPSPNEIPMNPFEKGGSQKVPEPDQPYWVSHQCQFLGHQCTKFTSCLPKYRLRLHGCPYGDVCCNIGKTRSCRKIGGECRKKCRDYEVPNRYIKCSRLLKKCCVTYE
ncbi:uncharacterized protein LOC119450625 [Dermacentor silvarum]|uniref:uncharacterized protein LOC119450625 n=1 Tax=Dermacentor silvarum TaxID=543639 RepID=UPI0018997AEC|nr:uncharacterized protein LOC119450625 [Dermacentor silvarum]